MSLTSHKSGTTFQKPSTGPINPSVFACYIIKACTQLNIPVNVQVVSQGLGTIDAEGTFDPTNWGGDGEHIGPWAEESGFGSRAERMDPWHSTFLAMKHYKSSGNSFQQGWWNWEGGETEGTGKDRAAKYQAIAQAAIVGGAGTGKGTSGGGISGAIGELGETAFENTPLGMGIGLLEEGISDPTDFLSEAFSVLTDFRKLGQLAAEGFSWFLRLIAKAVWDYVVAPVVHWTERAVSWYWVNFFGEGVEQGSGFGYQLRNNAGTITILFWSMGYAILWSNGESTSLIDPHESMLGQGIKGITGRIARRKLIEPKKVKEKTPEKPTPKVSVVKVEKQDTFSVGRKRPVTVGGNSVKHTEGRQRRVSNRRFTPAPVPRPGTTGKKLVVAQGYSRKARATGPTQKSTKPRRARVDT